MIIQSSWRHRLAANWHEHFTRRLYGATDDHVETLPVCMPLPAACPVGCFQRRLGRRRRIPHTDYASGGGGGARGTEDERTASEISQDRRRQVTNGEVSLMRAFRDLSIRRKLTLMGILASGTALLLACAAFLAYELFSYRAGMINALSIRANIIGVNSASAILFNDEAAAVETLAALKTDPHTIAAGLYARDNRIFASYVRDVQTAHAAVASCPAAQPH